MAPDARQQEKSCHVFQLKKTHC